MAQEDIDLGKKTWDSEHWGPDGAVALGRRRYRRSQRTHADRVVWMSTTYSALGDARPHVRRLQLRWFGRARVVFLSWREEVRYFCNLSHLVSDIGFTADQAETVSRSLLAYSRLPLIRRTKYRRVAATYASYAYVLAKSEVGGHTSALATNTLAEISFLDGMPDMGQAAMDAALDLAHRVVDANQQSRVYRQLAELACVYVDDKEEAREFLDQADKVPGIDFDVRKKNAETRRKLGL